MLQAFDSGRLFGAVHGSGPPRVLALHGWRRTSADFAQVLAGLDALALDLPGFGASPAPPEPWGTADYADALAPVLADIATPVVVLGHSFGGRVAVRLAARRPDSVKALVLTGVPLVRPPGRPARPPAAVFRAARWLHRRGLLPEARMEAVRQRYGSADYRAATGVMRDVFVKTVNEDYAADLGAVTCPVELVWGDDDPDVPPAVAEAAAALLEGATHATNATNATHATDATVTLVPGAGHLTPLTAAPALRAALERHLT